MICAVCLLEKAWLSDHYEAEYILHTTAHRHRAGYPCLQLYSPTFSCFCIWRITGVSGVLSGSIYRTYSAPQVLLGVEVDMFYLTFLLFCKQGLWTITLGTGIGRTRLDTFACRYEHNDISGSWEIERDDGICSYNE